MITDKKLDDEILFHEKQKFKQLWIWVLLLGVNGFNFFRLYKEIIIEQQFTIQSKEGITLVLSAVLVLIVTIMFLFIRLDTVIKSEGIYIRFFPLHIKPRYISWEIIAKCYVRQYNPVKEYGGWGFRLGAFGSGRAYNISGNKGLQLEFGSGKKILIGTQKPEELTEVLTALRQYKEE